MALCTRCGQQTEAEAEFCPACGGYAADGYGGSPTLASAVAAAAGPAQHTSAAGPARDYPLAGGYAPVRYAPPDGYPPAPRADGYLDGGQVPDGDSATGGALPPATLAAATGRLRYEQSTADPDPRELWYAPSAPAGSYRAPQADRYADDDRWPFGPDAATPPQQAAEPQPWPAQPGEPQPWPAQQAGVPQSRPAQQAGVPQPRPAQPTAEPPAVLYAPRPFRLDAPDAPPAEPRPWHAPPPGLGSPDHAAGLAQPPWPGSHFAGQPADGPAPARYAAASYAPPAHDHTMPDLLAPEGQPAGPDASAPSGLQAAPVYPAAPAFTAAPAFAATPAPQAPATPAADGTLLTDALTSSQPAGPDLAEPTETPALSGDSAGAAPSSAPAHSHSPRSGRWIALVAALVVLIIATATALLATANHGHTPAAGRPRGSASSAARPSASSAARPSARTSGLVRVTPAAAASPRAKHVVTFLNRYFDAINAHNFAAYRRLFTPSLRGGLSATAFQSGYGTTRDSAVTLRGVSATAAGEIQALVTFTSHQQASQSPTHSACTDWRISLYLVRNGARYALATPPGGYSASDSACG